MINNWLYALLITFVLSSCTKFLEEKPNQKLVVPHILRDLQALLEDPQVNNYTFSISAELSAGDYYLPNNVLMEMDEQVRNMYLWNKDNLFATTNNEWGTLYKVIYRCNVVLAQLEKMTPNRTEAQQWNAVKGSAHFLRASYYTQIAWLWSLAYDPQTASDDLGLVLRLSDNFNEPSRRVDVASSYAQIISDLKLATRLLPVESGHTLTPSRPAAYGQLSRVYLSMRDYKNASLYADSSLQLRNSLMDYNNDPNIAPNATYPFTRFNPEVLHMVGARRTSSFAKGITDSTLYDSYEQHDLRKTLFFAGRKTALNNFKGNYEGKNTTGVIFSGPATDEMYLNRAECLIRMGDVPSGLNDLNTLLIKRYKKGTFSPYANLEAEQALKLVLSERRKELLFRGLRWMDIKRLNKEGAGIVLSRLMDGTTYRIDPNSLRYALPIPENVIQLTGIQQNPR
jgi:hypothetical protein